VLFAALFLGEALTVATVAGGAMVVAGGMLVTRLAPAFGLEAPPPGDEVRAPVV
jgi:drug/metabolite transporter (DMT)-like permease